jgi:hypothetical protein
MASVFGDKPHRFLTCSKVSTSISVIIYRLNVCEVLEQPLFRFRSGSECCDVRTECSPVLSYYNNSFKVKTVCNNNKIVFVTGEVPTES